MLSIHRIRMQITPKLSVPDGGKMAATLARFRRQPPRRCLGAKRTTSVARVDISRTIARRDFKLPVANLQPPDDYCPLIKHPKHKNLLRLVGMGTFLTIVKREFLERFEIS